MGVLGTGTRWLRVVIGWLLAIGIAGCGAGTSSETEATMATEATAETEAATTAPTEPSSSTTAGIATPPVDILGPEEAAATIGDPARVEQGIWSLLDGLAIGVYRTDGSAVLVGSDTDDDDFWINDFQIGWLTALAGRPDVPFADFHAFIAQFAPEVTPAELVAAFRESYAEVPDAWLVRFVNAMGGVPDPDGAMSPLLQWVLALDLIVPPNGVPATALSEPGAPIAVLARLQQGESRCEREQKGRKTVGWGYISKAKGLVDGIRGAIDAGATALGGAAKAILDPKDLLHALMMQGLVDIKLETTTDRVHERHADGPFLGFADEVGIAVTASFVWDVPKEDRCLTSLLHGFDIPEVGGKDLEGAQVAWSFPEVMGQHGTFSTDDGEPYHRNHLDEVGQQIVIYRSPAELPGGRRGTEATGYRADEPEDATSGLQSAAATIEATVRVQMGDVFNVFAGVQEIFFPRTVLKTITIQWHEAGWRIVGVGEVPGGPGLLFEGELKPSGEGLQGQGTATFAGSCVTLGTQPIVMTGAVDGDDLVIEFHPDLAADLDEAQQVGCDSEGVLAEAIVFGPAIMGVQAVLEIQGPFRVPATAGATFSTEFDLGISLSGLGEGEGESEPIVMEFTIEPAE
jgi:hypothetical protein